jgi:hypothetical protein
VIPKQNGKGKPILAGISVEVKPVCKNPKIRDGVDIACVFPAP